MSRELPRPVHGFRVVSNPDVLGLVKHRVSARFEPDLSSRRAVEYAAGRRCAALALAAAGSSIVSVGTNPDRSPAWPTGYTGSITHTVGFASACVASLDELVGVGIDAEPVIDRATLAEVRAMVASDAELRSLDVGLPDDVLVTLVFSAKESLYKSIAPIAQDILEFLDVEIQQLDLASGRFSARLIKPLTLPFDDRCFEGRFAIEAGLVHTGVELLRHWRDS